MKITSHITRISPSKIQETSPKQYLNSIINKISKCALALLIGLPTITTLMPRAAAYPGPRVAKELATTTTTIFPDSVEIIPIEEVNGAYMIKCILPNMGSLLSTPCKAPKSNSNWSCTIL